MASQRWNSKSPAPPPERHVYVLAQGFAPAFSAPRPVILRAKQRTEPCHSAKSAYPGLWWQSLRTQLGRTIKMKLDNDDRRRATLLKYTLFVLIAYSITQVATLFAHLFGLSSVSYAEIGGVAGLSLGISLVFVVLIKLKKTLTPQFTKFVFFGQFVAWLVLYAAWLLVLRETRVMALFFGLMALTFSLSNTRSIQSLVITLGTCTIQIAGSFVAIYYLQQPGSFALEVFYTLCFLPSALFICSLSGQYAKQRVEIKEAKRAAEHNSAALVLEMDKVRQANAELERALGRIEELAIRDELTGLYNRRYLMDALEREKKRADRTGRLFSMIMLDIDHFKRVNDTYGHLQGDVVLKAVAKAVQAAFRVNDFSARYGGEEFVVVLEEVDPAGAVLCTDRLRKSIEALQFPEIADGFSVTVSLGYTQFQRMETVAQTLARADAALYRAKDAGRNRAEFD
ncbi:MAG: hypothetical protein CFE43_20880 [Burkholderiales bacterium PBB3]|nr:MAG: hypothetical protein CFE43_20880 [Burkholderiales bacterium PBB3]